MDRSSATPGAERRTSLEVGVEDAGRLDRFLCERLALSRTRVQRLIADGFVRVDGRPAKKSEAVEAGSRIDVTVPEPATVDIAAEDLPLDVVYEDEMLIVVNKPAGMVVHPAPGHHSGTLVNALLHHVKDLAGVGGRMRPGIVHRLDKDTSGLLVVAKTDLAHHALSDQLRLRKVKRIYQAATWGHLDESTLTIDAPIGRDPRHRRRMAVVEGGRRAVTRVRVRERWERADLLDVSLQTGRTHQIRVHLAHLGHPIVGDELYGARWERGFGGSGGGWARDLAGRVPRQFLHAAVLLVLHPGTGEQMRFQAPLPSDLATAARWAREASK